MCVCVYIYIYTYIYIYIYIPYVHWALWALKSPLHQELQVLFDTASGHLLVPHSACESRACRTHGLGVLGALGGIGA